MTGPGWEGGGGGEWGGEGRLPEALAMFLPLKRSEREREKGAVRGRGGGGEGKGEDRQTDRQSDRHTNRKRSGLDVCSTRYYIQSVVLLGSEPYTAHGDQNVYACV